MDVLYPAEAKPIKNGGDQAELGSAPVENNSEQVKTGNPNGESNHDPLDYEPTGWLETTLLRASSSTEMFMKNHKDTMSIIAAFIFNGLVFGFFFGCLYYWLTFGKEPLQLCKGFGSLIALLCIVYFFVIYFMVIKRYCGQWLSKNVWSKVDSAFGSCWKFGWFRWCFSLAILRALSGFILWDTWQAPQRLMSLSGLAIILLAAFVFSAHPGRVKWRTVLMGLLIQFLFGILFIRWEPGRVALQCFSDKVSTFLSYGIEGAAFTFGDLLVRTEGVFAFNNLPIIFFFSMLVEVLFYYGALQWFVLKLGHLLRGATGTTVCESVICVGNVFLGTESVLLIKPYLSLLTPSEIHVVMASGFATVAALLMPEGSFI